jgi:hypothetical protein
MKTMNPEKTIASLQQRIEELEAKLKASEIAVGRARIDGMKKTLADVKQLVLPEGSRGHELADVTYIIYWEQKALRSGRSASGLVKKCLTSSKSTEAFYLSVKT